MAKQPEYKALAKKAEYRANIAEKRLGLVVTLLENAVCGNTERLEWNTLDTGTIALALEVAKGKP